MYLIAPCLCVAPNVKYSVASNVYNQLLSFIRLSMDLCAKLKV